MTTASHPAKRSYSPLAKAAHWLLLLLCIVQFPTARAIDRTHTVGDHPFGLQPSAWDLFLHQVHAWSGWAIGGLALILFVGRLLRRAPDLPTGMRPWQRRVAEVSHFLLYGCLAGLVVTGTGAMYLWRGFGPIHTVLTQFGIALVAGHVAATLWHQFVRRDGLLLRLLPRMTGAK